MELDALLSSFVDKLYAPKEALALDLPTLYPLQAEIDSHPAKYKVVICGRRFGKTILAAHKSVRLLQQGKRILLSSATQDQADVFWAYARKWTTPLPNLYKNEGRRILRYGDGELRVKTGSNPEVLKGDHFDFVALDECALLDARVWYEVALPMLADTDGDAVFLSTPKRRNWLWELFVKAQADTSGDWAVWNAPTHANPYLKPEVIDRLIENMTTESYQQEIMAQFLEGQGAVFRNVDACATVQPDTVGVPCMVTPYEGKFCMGVDWAQTTDSTVITVMDIDMHQLVALDRFNGVNWETQRGRLRALYDLWKPAVIIAESNSIGSPNIEALQAENLPVRPFQTTAQSKPPLIESLVLAFERQELAILNYPILTNELKAYERTVSTSGRSQYSAPSGMHDDCVISLALAWYGIMAGQMTLPIILSWD